MKKLLAIALLFLVSFEVKAQFMEDGVRLLNNNGMISSRSGSMGIGFAGIADDFSALYYNPAGLSLIPKAELSIGFGISNINNDNNFKWDTHSIDVNDEFISHIGVASPLRSNTGLNSVIAVGYFREASFDNTVKIEGFNNSSTYIRNDAERNGTNGFAHDMYLSNGNVTPYQNDLTQSAYIDESGGIHNVIGGAGFELTDQVSIGFSIVGKWGSYSYSKDFRETDTQNKYKTSTDEIYGDLDELQVKSHVTQDISGISGTVGFLAKPTENSRISVGVKFPTKYSMDEEFYTDYYATFDTGDFIESKQKEYLYNSYSIYTPFVYNFGFSYNIVGLTTSIGIEYSDASQMEFSSSTAEIDTYIEEVNRYIVEDLGSQLKYGIAFEYFIPAANLFVRAGYTHIGSPYKEKDLYSDISKITGGLGVLIGKDVMLNLTFMTDSRDEERVLYGSQDRPATYTSYDVSNTNMYFGLGLSYRY